MSQTFNKLQVSQKLSNFFTQITDTRSLIWSLIMSCCKVMDLIESCRNVMAKTLHCKIQYQKKRESNSECYITQQISMNFCFLLQFFIQIFYFLHLKYRNLLIILEELRGIFPTPLENDGGLFHFHDDRGPAEMKNKY